MKRSAVALMVLLFLSSLWAQQDKPRRKPVLIRADRSQEEVKETPPLPDPEKAREHVDVGDFYYKRDNYKAAEERYREAIRYNPKWPEAYEKLVRSLEKQKAFGEAIKICEQFIERNPASEDAQRFQKWAGELAKENQEKQGG